MIRAGVSLGLSMGLVLTGLAEWSASAIAQPLPESVMPEQEMMLALRQSEEQWIEVNVTTQRLIAWEGDIPVYAVIVSTGNVENPTPTGIFEIQTKLPVARMRGEGYDVPDVPFVMYYDGNYAIHGAYWHHRFGTPVSHGCTNVAVDHAEWLFNWASVGTMVVVHD
jgi:lipoprotein-anchoring transpeptidase ErfK/SrfK